MLLLYEHVVPQILKLELRIGIESSSWDLSVSIGMWQGQRGTSTVHHSGELLSETGDWLL